MPLLVYSDLYVGSNVLMTKSDACTCKCSHPMLCDCNEDDTIICKVSDFDLVDVAASDEIANSKWIAKLIPNPGGSRGMIAPEVNL